MQIRIRWGKQLTRWARRKKARRAIPRVECGIDPAIQECHGRRNEGT